jgi:hypothetical protein
MSIDNLQLLVKKRFLRSASLSHPHTPKAIAFQHLQTRFLRSASLSHSHIPTYPKAIPTERFAIALPKSQTAIALPKSQTAIPTERFAIALPTSPKAIAPHIPKQRFLRSASLSHSQHPLKAIASPHP